MFNFTEAPQYLPVFDIMGDCAIHHIWPFYRDNDAAQIILSKLIKENTIFIDLFKTLVTKPYFYQVVHYRPFFQAVQDAETGILEIVEKIIFEREFVNFQYVRVGFFNFLYPVNITPDRCKKYKDLLSSLNGSFYLNFNNIGVYVQLDHRFLTDVLSIMMERAGGHPLILNWKKTLLKSITICSITLPLQKDFTCIC